ncbi:Gfo/Idh/MocA family protein [Cellulomonas aerilata]|uniref:Oxidoreductase n=1 Tax=Cellulomonas aerilata TaxID=515326 RepID=A0A512D9N8_9CELL|nr:Gfo/Idh/MocA family oxidoreductase [Cellulomonas aerilata]GEO33203.1 oxidoreductase [Cellulomonas aerilata]
MTTRRTLIIGTGAIADHHAHAVAQHGDRAVVVAGVDLDASRAQAFAAEHGLPAWGTDLATALAGELPTADGGTTGRPDLAHICTPPGSHVPLALQCLEAGVAVLLEKPPALSLAEMDVLIKASRRTGVQASVVVQHRFGGAGLRAARLLASGQLGRPLVATCDTLWFRGPEYYAVPWRGRWDVEGGGPTMGLGIHQLDLLIALIGPWAEVTAMAARQARDTATEDVSTAVVRFENGALATIASSALSPRQTSHVRVDAERATVEVEHLYGYGDEHWTVTPAPGHEDVARLWATDEPSPDSGHVSQLAFVLDAMDAGEPVPVTLADARGSLELVAAIYASAFTGTRVRRGDIGPGHPFYERMDGTGAPWA